MYLLEVFQRYPETVRTQVKMLSVSGGQVGDPPPDFPALP